MNQYPLVYSPVKIDKWDGYYLTKTNLGTEYYVNAVENVYLFTHEELEALKAECCIGLLEWMNKVVQESPMMLETDNDDIVSMYLQSIS